MIVCSIKQSKHLIRKNYRLEIIDYCPAVYVISNSKFKVSDKKIISCKKIIIIRTYIKLLYLTFLSLLK